MDTKTLCLGVLSLGAASGYDIRKQLEETFGHFMDVALSAVYPALNELEKEGLVTFEKIEQDKRPDKKVYTLTESGRRVFSDALQVLPPRHKVRSQFLLLLFYAQMLSPSRLQEVIDERIEELNNWTEVTNQWMQSEEGKKGSEGQHLIADYALAVMDAESKFLRENTGKFIKRLQQGGKRGRK